MASAKRTRSRTTLRGQEEILRKLAQMPRHFSAVLESVAPASQYVRDDAESNAPEGNDGDREFARLKSSIVVEERKRTDRYIHVRVGPSEDAPHGLWVENGHKIRRSKNGEILGTTPPNPFLGPAFQSNKNKVRRDIRSAFKRLIDSFR